MFTHRKVSKCQTLVIFKLLCMVWGHVMYAWLIEFFQTEGLQNILHKVSDHMAAMNKTISTFYKASTYICILTKPSFERFLLPLNFLLSLKYFRSHSLSVNLAPFRQHVWRRVVPNLASRSTSRLFINIAMKVTRNISLRKSDLTAHKFWISQIKLN